MALTAASAARSPSICRVAVSGIESTKSSGRTKTIRVAPACSWARDSASHARPSSSYATRAAKKVYTSVLQLIRERFGEEVSTQEQARDVDPDDIGGI